MDQARQMALIEAMHLADIRGSHQLSDSTADGIIEDAKKFYQFLSNDPGLKAV